MFIVIRSSLCPDPDCSVAMVLSHHIIAVPYQAVRAAREAREAKAGKWATAVNG